MIKDIWIGIGEKNGEEWIENEIVRKIDNEMKIKGGGGIEIESKGDIEKIIGGRIGINIGNFDNNYWNKYSKKG